MRVDAGAQQALTTRGVSLLAAGVVGVDGDFDEGDTVDIAGPAGDVFARGSVSSGAATVRTIAGKRTADLPADVPPEVVHRDALVVLV